MLKHLMTGSSLLALALREGENDTGADPKAKLREQIAKGNLPNAEKADVKNEDDPKPNENEDDDESDNEEDEEGDDDEDEEDKEKVEETAEQKAEREAKEKIEAKAKRKNDRMQARIDEATAKRKEAEAEVAKLKAQLEANPDQKLTEEEIQSRAEAIAAKKLADKNLEDINKAFQDNCDKLQDGAKAIDKDFDDKINDIAEQFGPIPSFMIATLSDMENGAEVLAYFANDDDFAESIYGKSPATMTRRLVEKSLELIAAKKKPKKQISKVPDPIEPVKGGRAQSNTITEADTKNMDNYVRKRQTQMLERRKLTHGY